MTRASDAWDTLVNEVIFPYVPHIGEKQRLQLLDRGQLTAQIMWAKDGRIGLSFTAPAE
jgi:hypothetical protein